MTEEEVENNAVGEHEDDDVRTERQKVSDILSNRSADPPVVVVQVIYTSSTDFGIVMFQNDCLCGLVARVLGCRSRGPGSIPGTTRKKN
jgi:hypothetical protein